MLLYISGLGITVEKKWAQHLLIFTLYGITAVLFFTLTAVEIAYIRNVIIQRRVSAGDLGVLFIVFAVFSSASYAAWKVAGKFKGVIPHMEQTRCQATIIFEVDDN